MGNKSDKKQSRDKAFSWAHNSKIQKLSKDKLREEIRETKFAERKEKEEERKEAQAKQETQGEKAPSEPEKAKKDLEQMTELAKRTMADMQNLRRRHEEERAVLITMGNEDLIKKILPIIDNLERALKHTPQGAEEWAKGIDIAINQMIQVLREFGLKPIESAVGKIFNPIFHQAVVHEKGEKDIVLEEIEKGYMFGEKVLRPTKVKVGNGEKN